MTDSPSNLERLQKVLAQAGVASRRHAEDLITAGRVRVNGEVVSQLGTKVDAALDTIEVDGSVVPRRQQHAYYMLNKPIGYVTTVRDPHSDRTVMQLLPNLPVRVYPVGRLDRESEGLLLLTNDGELAHRLSHPRYGIEKEYLVDVEGTVSAEDLDRIRLGVVSDNERLVARSAEIRGQTSSGSRLALTLTEGKKREIRRMLKALGYAVTSLKRVRYGPLELRDLPSGAFRALQKDEIERLRAVTSG